MFKKYVVICLSLLVVFCSCKNEESKEDVVIRVLGEQLEEANAKINTATKDLYWKLAAKLEDYKLRERAIPYNEKAQIIKIEAGQIYYYLDSISKLKNIDWTETNIRLKKTREIFIQVDNYAEDGFFNDIKKTSFTIDSIFLQNDYKSFFDNLNHNSTIALVSKIENNIRNLEYNILRHFDSDTTPGCNLLGEVFGTLVGQSTSHLRNGEQLEISAGVGAFSTAYRPYITIDNKKIETLDGRATYKTKINGSIGKHTIPVKFEFTDESGLKRTKIETVEYTIDK